MRDCRSLSWCIKKGLRPSHSHVWVLKLYLLFWLTLLTEFFLFFQSLFCSHLRQIENDNHQNTRRAMETTPQKQSVVPLTEVFCFSESPPHLKIHSYRAAVQYVLTEMWPGFQHPTTRLVVKKGAEVPFPQYVSLVLVYLPCLSLSPILQYVSLVSVRLPSLSVSPLSQYVSLVLVYLPCLSLSPFPMSLLS